MRELRSVKQSALMPILAGILALASAAAAQESPSWATTTEADVKSRLAASGLQMDDVSTTFVYELRPETIHLASLEDVILETLANNLDVRLNRLDREIAADEIMMEHGIYDPTFSAGVNRVRVDQINSYPEGGLVSNQVHQNIDTYEAGLSQFTSLGGVFELKYSESNTDYMRSGGNTMVSPFYEERLSFGLKQPLLRNFGPMVNNARIRIARLQREATQYNLLAQIDTQVADVMKTYWELVFAVENLSVKQIFLKQARDLLRINQIKYDTGVLSITDVLQARAQVAFGEAQVIQAQSQILAVQDRLKQLMNIDRERPEWNAPLIPKDLAVYHEIKVADEEALSEALSERPDLAAAREWLKITQLASDVARRQRLPELNAFGEVGFNGGGGSSGHATDRFEANDHQDYLAGVEFKYPIFNRKARYEYRKSLKEIEQARTLIEKIELGVTMEIRAALRQLRTSRQQILANQRAVESEEAKLDSELKRFDVGMATSFEVLTFQKDLADARVGYIRSVVDYNLARVELDRARARLRPQLEEMGIVVEPRTEAETPQSPSLADQAWGPR